MTMRLPSLKVLVRILPLLVAGAAVYHFKFKPTAVDRHQVALGDVAGEVMGVGTLEARVKSTVSARVQERLLEVLVDQGDTVASGQLLARLDDAEIRRQVAVAEAALAAARQTAARVGADLARSEAVLAQATRDQQRLAGLLASNAVSQTDADKAAEARQVAEADLNRSNAAIAEAQGQVLVEEKTLLHRKEQMAFTEIRSPYDGLVIRRDREPGDMLVPGGSLLEIISLAEIWVRAWIDETAIPELAEAQPARIVFRAEPDRPYPGVVSRLGRETDRETREFLVDVRVNELPKNWTIGQRAEVFIETGRDLQAVQLPPEFLVWKDGRAGVMVPVDGRARWREVTLGRRGRRAVAVRQGLAAGETVIRPGGGQTTAVRDGQRLPRP